MIKHKAYKFEIYPDNSQVVLFSKTFGCCRLVYNLLLSDKTDYYKETKQKLKREVSFYKKQEEYIFLKEVDSLALANAKLNLDNAYEGFFKKRTKFPKFKKKGKAKDSYTTNRTVSKTGRSNIELTEAGLKLPKVGVVKTKQHRPIGSNETIKSVTISRVAGKYYASILVEYEAEEILPTTDISLNDVIGFDFSVPHFAVDSNGNAIDMPHYYRRAEKKLAKEQKMLSKKQFRSKNYGKQQLKVQKIHNHVANQRKDFIHKLTRELVNSEYKVFAFEDLNLSNMKRTLKLGKSISDNGFGMFRDILKYKAEAEGKYFVKIDKWFASTKTCSHCGYKNNTITLATQEWICPECNAHHLRDHNAAINIKKEGYEVLLKTLQPSIVV